MSDEIKKGGNVQKDFGINAGNIANIRQIVSPSGISVLDLGKVEHKEVEIPVPDPWIVGTNFQNGWTDQDYPDHMLKFMKHPDGQVEIRGHIGGGPLGLAYILPPEYAPAETIYFACGDGTANYRSTIAIDAFGSVFAVYGNDPWIQAVYLAADSRPVPLSCFPIYLKTEIANPVGVFVIDTQYGENKRSPYIRPGAAANHCDWSFVKKADGNYIQINNLTGLPYNQKTKVRFMIVGE